MIVGVYLPQAVNQAANRGRFGRRVARLLHVEVVDDLPDALHQWSPEIEPLRKDFERAQRALMAEVSHVHVKGHVGIGGPFDEREPRLRVYEASNQPGGRHPIDTGTWPRYPSTGAKVRDGQARQVT